MKKHMKLMRIYDIEKNYQLHKQRLNSIKSTDNTNKIIQDVLTNIQKVKRFKQHKINSQIFTQKQKLYRINTENNNLRDKMQELSQRLHLQLTQQKQSKQAKSQFRLSRKKSVFENINQDNEKIRQRLSKTKSLYFRITKNLSKSHSKKINRQDEIIYLLQKQLKISPNVMFPVIKKHNKSHNNHMSVEAKRNSMDLKEKSLQIKQRSAQVKQKSTGIQQTRKQSRMSRIGSKQHSIILSSNSKVKERKQQKLRSFGNSII